jgi:hypothetical protein
MNAPRIRRDEDLLALALDAVRSGHATAEEWLTRDPERRSALAPLLQTAARVALPDLRPNADFVARLRLEILGTARP